MRKDDDFSLSTHSLRTVVYIRKEVPYRIVKKSVKIRKLFLYAFFTGSLGIGKFEISCCVMINSCLAISPRAYIYIVEYATLTSSKQTLQRTSPITRITKEYGSMTVQ